MLLDHVFHKIAIWCVQLFQTLLKTKIFAILSVVYQFYLLVFWVIKTYEFLTSES